MTERIDPGAEAAPPAPARPSAELAELALARASRAIELGDLGAARGWIRLVGEFRRLAMQETGCGTWTAALDRAVGAPLRRQAGWTGMKSGLPDSDRTQNSALTSSPNSEIRDLPDSVDSLGESGLTPDASPSGALADQAVSPIMPRKRLAKRAPKSGRKSWTIAQHPNRSKLEMARQISGLGP